MKKVLLFVVVAAVLAGGVWYYMSGGRIPGMGETITPTMGAAVGSALDNVVTEPAPPLGPTYTNKAYRFSLQMPADYNIQELPNDEGEGQTITIQNAKGDGVQILITKYPDAQSVLTADDVRASIPDMRVVGEQPVEVGSEYTGVAFMSDNEAFAGASREVWFFFGDNLYQISTYARLDPLLQAMFGTWKFF